MSAPIANEIQLIAENIVQQLQNLQILDPTHSFSYQSDSDGQAQKLISELIINSPTQYQTRLTDEFFHFGPIEVLLNDPEVTEILVNAPNQIYFEKFGQLNLFEDQFLTAYSFDSFIQRLSQKTNFHISVDTPFVDAHYKNFRIHIAFPPITPKYPALSFRKHPTESWRFDQLKDLNWASPDQIAILKKLVQSKKNFLVIGETGSGKTSTLSACLQEIQNTERTIIIEDTSELPLPNQSSLKLLTRFDSQGILKNYSQTDLVKQSLRMRPDRIVLGEIRGAEAQDLLMAFATGHQGCMSSMHAHNPQQALIRLEMLIQMGANQWSLSAIRRLILLSISYIVVVRRSHQELSPASSSKSSRFLEGIYRICSLEDHFFTFEKVENSHDLV